MLLRLIAARSRAEPSVSAGDVLLRLSPSKELVKELSWPACSGSTLDSLDAAIVALLVELVCLGPFPWVWFSAFGSKSSRTIDDNRLDLEPRAPLLPLVLAFSTVVFASCFEPFFGDKLVNS